MATIIHKVLKKEKKYDSFKEFYIKNKTQIPMIAMSLPALILVFMFSYVPMFGIILAFKDFNVREGIFGSPWCGFSNFSYLFKSNDAFIMSFFPFENTDNAKERKIYMTAMETQSFTLSIPQSKSFCALIVNGIIKDIIKAGKATDKFFTSSVHFKNSYTAIAESAAINILNNTVSEKISIGNISTSPITAVIILVRKRKISQSNSAVTAVSIFKCFYSLVDILR